MGPFTIQAIPETIGERGQELGNSNYAKKGQSKHIKLKMSEKVLENSPQELKDLLSPHKLTGRITGPGKRSITGGTST